MSIIDLFFPKQVKCVTCGKETNRFGLCDDCIKLLKFIDSPTCAICGGPLTTSKGKACFECKGRTFAFAKNYSIFEYSDDVRNKIVSFKQNSNVAIGEMFSYFIEDKFKEIITEHKIDLVIPVPISDERYKVRKFNQSEILCGRVARIANVNTEILVRIKDTPHQTGLSKTNREENLKDAFVLKDKKAINNKTILLVDDIYTTGSTLQACARTLSKAKPKEIYSLTLARTPIKKDKVL